MLDYLLLVNSRQEEAPFVPTLNRYRSVQSFHDLLWKEVAGPEIKIEVKLKNAEQSATTRDRKSQAAKPRAPRGRRFGC